MSDLDIPGAATLLDRLQDESISIEERLQTGNVLALMDYLNKPGISPDGRHQIGQELLYYDDPRPGVGLDDEGYPALEWVSLPDQAGRDRQIEISRYPITVRQYRTFQDAPGYYNDRWWTGNREELAIRERGKPYCPDLDGMVLQDNYPVTGVTLYECQAFARWLSANRTLPVRLIRLPEATEWEQAASGQSPFVPPNSRSKTPLYPWGDRYQKHICHNQDCELDHPVAVGVFLDDKSPTGALDMGGNVMEWTNTLHVRYSLMANKEYIVKSSSWVNPGREYARIGYRGKLKASTRIKTLGFRVVRITPIQNLTP